MIRWRSKTEQHLSPLWLALTVLLVAACSPPETNVSLGNRTGVLYYGIGSEVQTIDPHVVSDTGAFEVAGALFEGLVRHNAETMEPEPGVAES